MNNILYKKIQDLQQNFTKLQISKITKITDQVEPRLIDVLLYLPYKYSYYDTVKKINESHINSDIILDVRIILHSRMVRFKNIKKPYSIKCATENDTSIMLKFFQYNKTYLDKYETGKVAKIRGKLTFYKGMYVISHPVLIGVYENFKTAEQSSSVLSEISPKYHLKDGVKSSDIVNIVKNCIEIAKNAQCDIKLMDKSGNLSQNLINVIKTLHFPKNEQDIDNCLYSLSFSEFVANFLSLKVARDLQKKNIQTTPTPWKNEVFNQIINNANFQLTGDQESVINLIKSQDDKNLHLIQGDVGSGKTIVAQILSAQHANSKQQVLFLAPTTILATQHYENSEKLFKNLGIISSLLTSKVTQKKRENILKHFKDNEIQILFGTHSLLSDEIIAKNLHLVIIDEQHKFGVNQRLKIIEKSSNTKTIMLSATPIPRTMIMGMYGDITIHEIKTKPAFQKPIITSVLGMSKYNELTDRIKRKISENEQIYWICNTIDSQDEKTDIYKRKNDLISQGFTENQIGILHGKMREAEKNETMTRFKNEEFKILIATTVVEVGVNVPNATIIIIEDANKFGLSQLHQLRGRVGRGEKQSYCVLLFDDKTDCDTARLEVLKKTNDGFEIAKEDMKIRGFGNILGTEQSGDQGYIVANVNRDFTAMENSIKFFKDLINSDINIEQTELDQFLTSIQDIFTKDNEYRYISS